ncbi:SWIM zinc finger domain-containing protein [Calothrix sp. PCC 7507]|uniref:SWIM zinc finger family protein n=1 Tax=Calothrix sp. PCC 7507 TaxID=99598 RepID=UPI00029EE35D|nr:SWIM zinc finger domain-containing protein [Calothrix sp. PCC 7507]AFY35799.1 zinc finger SWIM domain-containing protein [Calothrix sp. PCC 7507]
MPIPNFSEFTIRRNTNSKSFQRGESYYEADAVITVIQRGNVLQAKVEGHETVPYRVNLSFNSEGLTSVHCSCAYNSDGWCKHIVATMLVCLRQPETIQERPTLERLLDRLDHTQTQRLLQDLVAQYPKLIEAIDRHVSLMSNPVSQQPIAQPVRLITVDPKPLRDEVRQILRDGSRSLAEGYEEDPISDELLSLVQTAVNFSERGDGNNAIAILEAITSTCAENWDDVAEYGVENDEIVWELNDAWCEAILTAELSEEEKVDVQVNLEAWQDEWNADFGLAFEALRQGWDYPPLVQVLQGNLNEMREWEALAPDYAESLALIRLKILEREERYQEYLYLAEASGQTQQHLTMLVRLGRAEEAIAIAQMQMDTAEIAFALAKILAEKGLLPQALDIAQTGLDLPGHCQYQLGIWTSDLAEALGNRESALFARQTTFQIKPSFFDYQKIADLAGEDWENVKTNLLRIIHTASGWDTASAKVDIYLYEGLIEDAIAVVSELSSYHTELIHRVMKAATTHNPDWVITNACRRAESIMDAGKAENYSEAIEWLKKARAAYLDSGRKADWSSYRAKLIEIHARKRKLMGMFKERGME